MKADTAFVSCVKSKLDHAAPAKDLYMPSAWFQKARAYAEKHARTWYILSAKHGCIHPDTVIEPYEATLNGLGVEKRAAWARMVSKQFDDLERDLCGSKAVILAGLSYRRGLITPLEKMYGEVEVPMEGLMMGEQLSWLNWRLQ